MGIMNEKDGGAIIEQLIELSKKIDLTNSLVEQLSTRQEKMSDLITGNGTPEKGMLIKIDRLEQTIERWKWYLRTMGAAIIGLLVTAAWGYLKATGKAP